MFLMTAGDKGLEITSSSWPKAPSVTYGILKTAQKKGYSERNKSTTEAI